MTKGLREHNKLWTVVSSSALSIFSLGQHVGAIFLPVCLIVQTTIYPWPNAALCFHLVVKKTQLSRLFLNMGTLHFQVKLNRWCSAPSLSFRSDSNDMELKQSRLLTSLTQRNDQGENKRVRHFSKSLIITCFACHVHWCSTHTRMSRLWHPAGRLVGPCPRSPSPALHVRRCPLPAAVSAPWTGYVETLCSCSTEVEVNSSVIVFVIVHDLYHCDVFKICQTF